jgi:ABC-type transport system involved in multi-copper enzyme maturation permease subunit
MLIFGLLLIAGSKVLVPLSLGEEWKIIKDVGLAAISAFGALISIVVGAELVHKELERKTIYSIVSKPIQRYQFILGKYLGLLLTLLAIVAIMTAGFFLIVFWVDGSFRLSLLGAICFTYLELTVVTAVALFFSTFCTPTLSAVFAFIMYALGHLSGDLKLLAEKLPGFLAKRLLILFYYLLPNLENFNIRGQVVHGSPISAEHVGFVIGYGLIYAEIVLAITMVIFQRREFK